MHAQHFLRGAAGERRPPGEQLVSHRAKGVDIHAVVEMRIGRRLLRRHVGRRAEGHARRRQGILSRGLTHRLRDAEVHDQRVATGEHHVVGLDVAMDHAERVRVRERVGHLAEDAHRLGDRKLADTIEPRAQRLAVDVRHHVEEKALDGARVVEGQDMRVRQLGRDFDFPEKSLGSERGGELGTEHLDGDLAPVAHVVGEVDGRHPAGAELADDRVAVGQRGCEPVGGRHRFASSTAAFIRVTQSGITRR